MQRPPLTDRAALERFRARALGRTDLARAREDATCVRADRGAFFVHRLARASVLERLNEVNRTFTNPAIVTGHAEMWGDSLPGARIVGDEDTIALDPGAHDLVIHAMALHWAEDPVGQLVQCRRALRPDGLLLAVLPGGRTLYELRAALLEAEARLTGGGSPRVAPMAEVRDLGGLLQRAGLALPVADVESHRVTYPDALALMRELRAMGEANALAGRDRRVPPRALFAEAAAIYAETHPAEDGRVAATLDLVHLAGWAPSSDQPKPLRPGSARTRLADALSVPELPLPRN